jgi:hypothetical protein
MFDDIITGISGKSDLNCDPNTCNGCVSYAMGGTSSSNYLPGCPKGAKVPQHRYPSGQSSQDGTQGT